MSHWDTQCCWTWSLLTTWLSVLWSVVTSGKCPPHAHLTLAQLWTLVTAGMIQINWGQQSSAFIAVTRWEFDISDTMMVRWSPLMFKTSVHWTWDRWQVSVYIVQVNWWYWLVTSPGWERILWMQVNISMVRRGSTPPVTACLVSVCWVFHDNYQWRLWSGECNKMLVIHWDPENWSHNQSISHSLTESGETEDCNFYWNCPDINCHGLRYSLGTWFNSTNRLIKLNYLGRASQMWGSLKVFARG